MDSTARVITPECDGAQDTHNNKQRKAGRSGFPRDIALLPGYCSAADFDADSRCTQLDAGRRGSAIAITVDDDSIAGLVAPLHARAAIAYFATHALGTGGLRQRKHADTRDNANQR
jgi:hypothetical protein